MILRFRSINFLLANFEMVLSSLLYALLLIVCNSHNFAAKQKGRPRDFGRLKEDSHFSVEKIAEFIGDVLAVSDNGSCFIDGSKL